MIVDLHSHSDCSDGVLTPDLLIAAADEAGVELFSITDHDTIVAYERLNYKSGRLRLVPGVEFSAQWENRGIHILGLNIALNDSPVVEGARRQSHARQQRARLIAERLEKLGFSDAYAEATKYAPGDYLGRPHFAQYLVDCGAAANSKQAFKRYLGAGKAGDVKHHWASMATVIGWIKESGGNAVLAHPLKYRMTRSLLRKLAMAFKDAGGEGIELISGYQKPEDTRLLARLCQEMGLLASTGSDFHSPGQPWAALGKQAKLPDECCPVWSRW